MGHICNRPPSYLIILLISTKYEFEQVKGGFPNQKLRDAFFLFHDQREFPLHIMRVWERASVKFKRFSKNIQTLKIREKEI